MTQLKMTMTIEKSYLPCFQEKEVECQKCRKYQVTKRTIQCLTKRFQVMEFKDKWFKECSPIFDEKCKTKWVFFYLHRIFSIPQKS